MEQKTSNFQLIVLIVFGFFVVLGLVLFSSSKFGSNGGANAITPVVMWGTIPKETVNKYIQELLNKNKDSLSITYVQKDSSSFESDLINAIADDSGPDIIILPQDIVLKNINKFSLIPYSTYPLRTFSNQFIDASSVYLRPDGVVAIPFAVDPLVMYWNKTQFVNAGVVVAPTRWDEFSKDVTKLTKKDSNFNVLQSGVALGEYQNIDHAKDILSMLFMQAGVPVIMKNTDGAYIPALSGNFGTSEGPASVALTFYTDFANPAKDTYSWNKSLKTSLDSFIAGDTSIYFGYASELSSMSLKNPNLNFDVAVVPQAAGANKKSTFARVYGLAVLKSSKSQASALNQVFAMTSKDSIAILSSLTNLPPVRKDVLAESPTDQFMQTFYDSALISDTWLDPNSTETEGVFKNMIESVIIGKSDTFESVNRANTELENVISENIKIK